MVDPARQDGHERTSLSGLTEGEAKEFHRFFVMSFIAFTVIALIAHILTYMVAPWGPNI